MYTHTYLIPTEPLCQILPETPHTDVRQPPTSPLTASQGDDHSWSNKWVGSNDIIDADHYTSM